MADDTDDHAARRSAARRGVVGVLAGALIMLLAASAFAASGNGLGFLGLAGNESGSSPGILGGSSSGPETDRSRLAGWWGHNKATRFAMDPDFVPIPGATGELLTLNNLKPSDAGEYNVVVTNAFGSDESDPAELLIIPRTPAA